MKTRSESVALVLLLLYVLVAFLLRATSPTGSSSPSRDCYPTTVMMANSAEGHEFATVKDLPDFPGAAGRVSVSGFVLSSSCTALPGVQVRFWATRENGEYTDQSYGSTVSDKDGRYEFSLPLPIAYPGSNVPPHIHVAATVGGQVIMTEIRSLTAGAEVLLDLVPYPAQQSDTGTDLP